MALADATKIKSISCFNQAQFKNINEGFISYFLFSAVGCFVFAIVVVSTKVLFVILHSTALTTAPNCQNTKLVF